MQTFRKSWDYLEDKSILKSNPFHILQAQFDRHFLDILGVGGEVAEKQAYHPYLNIKHTAICLILWTESLHLHDYTYLQNDKARAPGLSKPVRQADH